VRSWSARAVMAVLLMLPHVCAASDWPQWRGPDWNGISGETAWKTTALTAARVLWRADVGKGYSGLAVVGDRAFTMGNAGGQDTVFCLNTGSGAVVWRYSYPCGLGEYPGPRATPSVDAGRVYTLSQEGNLFCLDRTSGAVVWSRQITRDFGVRAPTWGLAGSVRIVGDLVLLNAGSAGLALSKVDGSKVWASGQGPGGYSTPVVFERDGRLVAAIFAGSGLVVVDVGTGKLLWSFPWPTSSGVNAADPLLVGDRILISSDYGAGSALVELAPGGARAVWLTNSLEAHFASPVFVGGRIYGISGDARRSQGALVCVDPATGKLVWSTPFGFGGVLVAGDRLLASGSIGAQGAIVAVALGTPSYRELARTNVISGMSWTPPTLADGRLYCRNLDGRVVCLDLR
jgi:outer membrane protein assembly factor BamB